MSFAISCHKSPKGPAPVRIECLVKEADEQPGPNGLWEIDFKIMLHAEGWRGRAFTIDAPTEDAARARAYIQVIEELGTWLADLYEPRSNA